MFNEKFLKELSKVESILGQGLDSSCGAVGLTREDSVKITDLRDASVYALALIKICKSELNKKEDKVDA